MFQTITLIPIKDNICLSRISIALVHLFKKNKFKIAFFKPVVLMHNNKKNFCSLNTSFMMNDTKKLCNVTTIVVESIIFLRDKIYYNNLLDMILTNYYRIKKMCNILLIEGIDVDCKSEIIDQLNIDIARITQSNILLITSLNNNDKNYINNDLKILLNNFLDNQCSNVVGLIINKINSLNNCSNKNFFLNDLIPYKSFFIDEKYTSILNNKFIKNNFNKFIKCISWVTSVKYVNITNIINYLGIKEIFLDKTYVKKIKYFYLLNKNISVIKENDYKDVLLIIFNNQKNVLQELCLAIAKGLKLGAILVIGEIYLLSDIKKMFKKIFLFNIPILFTELNFLEIMQRLQNFFVQSINYNVIELKKIKKCLLKHINDEYIDKLITFKKSIGINNSVSFKYNLRNKAIQLQKSIMLPEGEDIRILQSASICEKLKLAKCILLGNECKIRDIALQSRIFLGDNIRIIDPEKVRHKYTKYLVDKRFVQGMDILQAEKSLQNNMILATLMLDQNKFNGIVSGVAHTTADTIRPALQLIKLDTNCSLISSVFFMLFSKRVLIFADCAINISPTAKELAEIAIQSSDTAKNFGIRPIIAMISYATGNSAKGPSVEKIKLSIDIVHKKRPDLVIDGPMQYDTAFDKDVAKLKFPKSLVAGKATIFIFPDLNTGNVVYKAVQRSANISAVGPILQGIRKPVNDLSRGASVEDIVYTILLTAIQSDSVK
ncbi:phosphate acetyltransferase [Buchnera aphidicola (Nipponaphis monzeni)]|uniref:Phosphate acetyltransferase n=1 Tax=Buchnera aphidicola (Nipponaphis monzeni) TaxID=2495405 RepID=A0A455T9X8_9GAMM|nr:phosphate acetyltransferase [Buchnera aphidicola]BBI01157.1 phosphate acetyltransferase [Buchnera aphidicola (Nipponaphis monzeni)]